MNQYVKKTLLISASALMFLSVGASTNNVSARRYHPRTARHYVRKHYRRGRRTRRMKKDRRALKRRAKRTSRKRRRRIRRYRTGYFDRYGTWHKYTKKAKPARRNAKKGRRSCKAKRSYYGGRKRKLTRRGRHRRSHRTVRRHPRHHETYAEKIGAARNENFNDVNADRESVGVDPIQRSSVLDEIAQQRSQQLVDSFSHYDDSGNWMAEDDLANAGYDSGIWNGENIMNNSGYGLNGTKAGDQANKQWWTNEAGATPDQDGGHRMNIRNPDFQSVGIGATYVPSNDAWYMCQDFSDETPDEIANGNGSSDQSSDQNDQSGSDDGGASAVAVAGGGDASASAGGATAVGGSGGNAVAGGGSAVGGSADGGNATGGSVSGGTATGGSAVGGAGGSASSVVGGSNGSNGGTSSSSSNGNANVSADGISVTSGNNGTYINGKQVDPNGTYNEPNGASVTFGNGNVTVRGADGSESSSSL